MKRFSVGRAFWVAVLVALLALPLGCKKEKPQTQEIEIGAILPLTGDLASHGEDAKNGVELAVANRNSVGGVNGRLIRVLYEDDRNNPLQGVSSFRKILQVEGVHVVLGGMTSTTALAIAPIAEDAKTVFFSPTASHPNLTVGKKYVFRNWPSDGYDAEVIANFASNVLGIKSFAVIYPNNDNGYALSQLFVKHITGLGGTVVLRNAYEADTTGFQTLLAKVKALTPEAVYLPGYYEDVARVLVQAKEIGLTAKFFCSSAVESPKLLEIAQNAAEGILYSKTLIDPNNENYKAFADQFNVKYNSTPGIGAAQCFDAVK